MLVYLNSTEYKLFDLHLEDLTEPQLKFIEEALWHNVEDVSSLNQPAHIIDEQAELINGVSSVIIEAGL